MVDIPAAALEAGALALSKYSHGSEVIWEEDARGFKVAITAALPHLGVLPVPVDLAARASEILVWQKTGILPGDALQRLADQRWLGDHAALQLRQILERRRKCNASGQRGEDIELIRAALAGASLRSTAVEVA